MKNFRFSTSLLSVKLLITMLLSMIGLIYTTLILQKWFDTGEWPFMVAEGYQYMEYIELTDQAHFYLPYYGLFIFAIPIFVLMFTSYSEKVKSFFAVFPFVVIIIDSASTFLIPYVWKGFALVLWMTGTILGITLLTLFILVIYDIWFRKVLVN